MTAGLRDKQGSTTQQKRSTRHEMNGETKSQNKETNTKPEGMGRTIGQPTCSVAVTNGAIATGNHGTTQGFERLMQWHLGWVLAGRSSLCKLLKVLCEWKENTESIKTYKCILLMPVRYHWRVDSMCHKKGTHHFKQKTSSIDLQKKPNWYFKHNQTVIRPR